MKVSIIEPLLAGSRQLSLSQDRPSSPMSATSGGRRPTPACFFRDLDQVTSTSSVQSSSRPTQLSSRSPATSAPSPVKAPQNKNYKYCMQCHATFQGFKCVRHHCRKCGRLVCSSCASYWQFVPEHHATKPQRVCTSCHALKREKNETEDLSKALSVHGPRAAELCKFSRPVACMDEVSGSIPCYFDAKIVWGFLHVRVVEAKGLLVANSVFDPSCALTIPGCPTVKTQQIETSSSPKWDALFVFEMCYPDAVLHIDLFGFDSAKSHENLGFVDLPLDALYATNEPFAGWVRVTLPGVEGNPGALRLEIQLQDVNRWSHFLSHIRPPEVPIQSAELDIDAVYGPALYLFDTLWGGFGESCFQYVKRIFKWENPLLSCLTLLFWNLFSQYLSRWPTLLPMLVVMYAIFVQIPSAKVILPEKQLQSGSVAVAHVDDSQLSFSMRETFRLLPRPFKSFLLDVLQPCLRRAADHVHLCHTILHEPGYLGIVVVSYVIWVVLWEACLHWIPRLSCVIVAFIGSLALIAVSPIMTAILGIVSYVQWAASGKDIPSYWEFGQFKSNPTTTV